MARLAAVMHFGHKGMAQGVQGIVAQHPVQVHPGSLGVRLGAGPGEKFPARKHVVLMAQVSRRGVEEGIVKEKQIRAVKSGIIQPPKPLDAPLHPRGQLRQHLLPKTIVGIVSRHVHHLD